MTRRRDDASRPVTVILDRSGQRARPLEDIAAAADEVEGVSRASLDWGDQVFVTTRNSLYSLLALPDGTYAVSGGWFTSQGDAPVVVGVNGCTWGGRAIRSDLVAAPGLCLEFTNGVMTTRIERVEVVRRMGVTDAVN